MSNESDKQPRFITCRCQHCDGGIEFDADELQPDTRVECPHCQMETILCIPQKYAESNQGIYPMAKSDFLKILIDCYKGRGFSFFVPGEQFVNQEQTALTKQTVFKAIAGVALTFARIPTWCRSTCAGCARRARWRWSRCRAWMAANPVMRCRQRSSAKIRTGNRKLIMESACCGSRKSRLCSWQRT